MPFRPPFLVAGEQFVENKMTGILSIDVKPRLSALCQTLRMAAHASDWGDLLNKCCRGRQTEQHGDDVCGGSCVVVRLITRTIPTIGNLRGGSFSFPPKPL
jgi:hypothetical protein